MKVVCIDNSTKPDLPLTIGKIYDASEDQSFVFTLSGLCVPTRTLEKSNKIHYSICCDDGITRNFHKSRFITLEEWRERKLNDLGV
jgi:hypothetical protein